MVPPCGPCFRNTGLNPETKRGHEILAGMLQAQNEKTTQVTYQVWQEVNNKTLVYNIQGNNQESPLCVHLQGEYRI